MGTLTLSHTHIYNNFCHQCNTYGPVSDGGRNEIRMEGGENTSDPWCHMQCLF